MKIRRILALALSLALAAALLAGCGGSRALSRVVADLLEGQYANVAVETDPELERALRRAAAEGGDIADILARLKNGLSLAGGALTLSGLGEGRQGERAVELRFEPGDDPDAAARRAFAAWNALFGGLPDDGQYAASVAMAAGEGGYYIAVDVAVVRAGTQKEDAPAVCTVTAQIGTGGSVTCNGNTVTDGQSVGGLAAGSAISFYAEPDSGYAVEAVTVTGGALAQNGNNCYTVTVNSDCTVTVSFGQIENCKISEDKLNEAVQKIKQELKGNDTTKDDIEVEVSIVSGQGVFGDELDIDEEKAAWFRALSAALHAAGTDEDTIARTAISKINEERNLMSVHNASPDDRALESVKRGEKGDYLCIYKYSNIEDLQSFAIGRFSGLKPSESGTGRNSYRLYITPAVVGDTNYAMIVLHGAYTGHAGQAGQD